VGDEAPALGRPETVDRLGLGCGVNEVGAHGGLLEGGGLSLRLRGTPRIIAVRPRDCGRLRVGSCEGALLPIAAGRGSRYGPVERRLTVILDP
jgi:hypothetical protein